MLLVALATGAAISFAGTQGEPQGEQRYFDQQEFPNYLLSKKLRHYPPGKIPKNLQPQLASEIAEIRPLLEAAAFSKLNRMTITVVEDGKVSNVYAFEYLTEKLGKIDPTLDLIPQGGTIRGALANIYKELYEAFQKNPDQDPKTLLRNIADSKERIPAGEILGVGSDLDVLFKNKNQTKTAQISEMGTEILNSARTSFDMQKGVDEAMRNVFFIKGDVQEYTEQMTSTVAQGGNELDHLALSMKTKAFLEPEMGRSPSPIVDDFIQGLFRYLPAEDGVTIRDPNKQVIRGPRPLTEIPFLQMYPDDVQFYLSQIQLVSDYIHNGGTLSPSALAQFDKLTRNGFKAGAHNRFHRAPLKKDGRPTVEARFLKLSRQVADSLGQMSPVLREFTDEFTIGKTRRPLNGLDPKLLMNPKKFVKTYTDGGFLYHGTDISSGIGILRGGLYISSGDQGQSIRGRGAYTSGDLEFVSGFAGKESLVLRLGLRKEKLTRMNILDFSDPAVLRALEPIQKQAEAQGRDFHEVLARDHGIDIIVNEHVLIQNTDVFNFPKDGKDLAESYANRFNSTKLSSEERIQAGIVYEVFGGFRSAQGEIVPHLDWKPVLGHALTGSSDEERMTALHAIPQLASSGVTFDSKILNSVEKYLHPSEVSETRVAAMEALYSASPNRSKIYDLLLEGMKSNDLKLASSCGEFIAKNLDLLQTNQPDIVRRIIQTMPKASGNFETYLAIDLRETNDSPAFYKLAGALAESPSFYVRSDATQLLAQPGRTLNSDLSHVIVSLLEDTHGDIRSNAVDALENIDFAKEKKWLLPAIKKRLSIEPENRVRIRISAVLSHAQGLIEDCIERNLSSIARLKSK